MSSFSKYLYAVIICFSVMTIASCQTPGGNTGSMYFDPLDGDTSKLPKVSGKLFKPESDGPFPAVVLLPHCGGADRINVSSSWPQFLVSKGYVALTVASYKSRGYGTCDRVPKILYQTHQAEDAYAALDYLASQDFVDHTRVVVMGFSAGGYAINQMIIGWHMGKDRLNEFRAAIAVYAGCNGMGNYNYRKNPMPLLQIAAEKDTNRANYCIDAANYSPMEIHVIPDAYHAFDSPEHKTMHYDRWGYPMKYSSSATKEAFEVANEFLNRNFNN